LPIPSAEKLCLIVAPYKRFPVTRADADAVRELRIGHFRFDAYCVECGENSIFNDINRRDSATGRSVPGQTVFLQNAIFHLRMACARKEDHQIVFLFRLWNNELQKIGQYPSLVDITNPQLKRYARILGKEGTDELRRAIELAAYDYGVGAFIYLRRVFEALLEDHRKAHGTTEGTPISNYDQMRIDERIEALKISLPTFLVEHRSIYGVLSKGVHELDEQLCLEYFSTIRDAIILILDQDLSARRRAAAETQLATDITKIVHNTGRKRPGK
jgi:hypothetical protein